ncbi:MAG: hypothetical protein ACI8QZ_004280 [Chlamydiales bacterium]|jgi:uncharacterized protein (DUF486 family)
MALVVVPVMLLVSSIIMAFAWLGHARLRDRPFHVSLVVSWLMVFPEYVLNVTAFRWGNQVYTGAQMAAFNMATGVICVALVARLFLREPIGKRQWLGFVLMALAIVLIRYP